MASVNFKRRNTVDDLKNVPIEDGNFILTKDGHFFCDFEEERVEIKEKPDLSMDDSSEKSVANKVVKSYVDNIFNKLKSIFLWENTALTSEFAEQNITLNSNDYDFYEIIYAKTISSSITFSSGKIMKGKETVINVVAGEEEQSYLQFQWRKIVPKNEITLSISDCTCKTVNVNTNAKENKNCIPLAIIGYKMRLLD